MRMFIETHKQSKGEIEEEQKKKDPEEKKEINYATFNILEEIAKIEEEDDFDASLYVFQLVAIQDEWRKSKSKPATTDNKEDEKGEEEAAGE